ncbi:hypothetical protein [Agrobacterium tumefaciens]|uniref:hypothetical protein n=1 Tax=Agrobacterium tumefaciens TaxID=358 RepID=UPI003C6C823B
MPALAGHAAGNEVHVPVVAIEAENIASIRPQESFGFRGVGRFSEVRHQVRAVAGPDMHGAEGHP